MASSCLLAALLTAFAGAPIPGAAAASHGVDPSISGPAPRRTRAVAPVMATYCGRLARQALAYQNLELGASLTRSALWPAVSVEAWAEVWTQADRRRHEERVDGRGGRVGISTDRVDGGGMFLASWALSPDGEVRDSWAPESEIEWTSPSAEWTPTDEVLDWAAIVSDPRRRGPTRGRSVVDQALGARDGRALRAKTRRRVYLLCAQHEARRQALQAAPTVEAARHQLLSIQRVRALLEAHLGGPLRSRTAFGDQP